MKKLKLLLGLFLLWPLLGSFTVKAAVVYPTDFGGFSDRTIYPIRLMNTILNIPGVSMRLRM